MKYLAFLLPLLVCLGCQNDSTTTHSPEPDPPIISEEKTAEVPEQKTPSIEAEEHSASQSSDFPIPYRKWEKVKIETLAGRPISFYLEHPEVDSLAVGFYEDPWIPMDDNLTFELIDICSRPAGELAPFYIWIMDRLVSRADGALAEGIAGNCARIFRQQAGSLYHVFGPWEPWRDDWDEDRVRSWVGLTTFGAYDFEEILNLDQLVDQAWESTRSENQEVKSMVKGLGLSIMAEVASFPELGFEMQPKSLADYINLLPAAKEIIGGWPYPVHEFDGQAYTLSAIDGSLMEVIYDPKNGYFMASDTEGDGEVEQAVALFRKADGTAIIGVEECYGCSEGHANDSEIHFLEWTRDQWQEMNAKVLQPSLLEMIEEDLRKDLPTSCEGEALELMIRLPQTGTRVPVRLVSNGFGDCEEFLSQQPATLMTWDKRIGTLMW